MRFPRFFESRLGWGDFVFFALFDEEGRLWHLNFGLAPARHFQKRLGSFSRVGSWSPAPEELTEALKQALGLYFQAKTPVLDFPHYLWATSFEKQVLYTLRQIPHGEICTYGWLAKRVGRPGGARAVGQVLSRNPLPLLFPCHRVVAKEGLGGFSGGLVLKRRLLALEGFSFDSGRAPLVK